MSERLQPHFSLKILFLSLFFLFLTLGVILLKTSADLKNATPTQILTLNFQGEGVLVKGLKEENFRKVSLSEQIISGTIIKTPENQTAELKLGPNLVVLNENTQLRLIDNQGIDLPDPLLTFELLQGEVLVKAEDPIVIQTNLSNINFIQDVGLLYYAKPETRLKMFSGDAEITFKKANGQTLTDFVVPLQNQISFTESQLTDVYATLKPSKLRKELKMISVDNDSVAPLLQAYLNNVEENEIVTSLPVINAPLSYKIQASVQNLLSYLSFSSGESQFQVKLKLQLGYLIGLLRQDENNEKAEKILNELKSNLSEQENDQVVQSVLKDAFSELYRASFNTKSYLARDFLIESLHKSEGPFLFRIYLKDLRNALNQNDLETAEDILNQWQGKWTDALIEASLPEYIRQSQILHYTLLTEGKQISIGLLNILDEAGDKRMIFDSDPEEARFEVAQERLQMTSALISSYRYTLAKQYLKNSYLTLDIGVSDPGLASTQVFLTSGTLLAQRIEYALTVLDGKAEPIEEIPFQEYLQKKQQEAQLVDELKSILDLEANPESQAVVEAPSIEDVQARFEVAGFYLETTNISPSTQDNFSFKIQSALLEAGSTENKFSIEGTYDFKTNTITQVKANNKVYEASFVLGDLVEFLEAAQNSDDDSNSFSASVDVFLADQDKLKTQEDQALARDVAIKFAATQLSETGLILPNLKSNVEVLDLNTLETFQIKNISLPTSDKNTISISFIYSTKNKLATDIRNQNSELILQEAPLKDLISEVKKKIEFQEKAEQAINDFMDYAEKNELLVLKSNISYTDEGYLELKDLELKTLGLKVEGLYDPLNFQFLSVTHPLLTSQNVELKTYFKSLAELYLIDLLAQKQIQIQASQIETVYPFNVIRLKNIQIAQANFDFNLDLKSIQPTNIVHVQTGVALGDMSFQELKIYVAKQKS